VLSLSDAEICNAIRSYKKRKASEKKKRKDLAVLAKSQRLNRFSSKNFPAVTLNQWRLPEHLKIKVKINKLAWKQLSRLTWLAILTCCFPVFLFVISGFCLLFGCFLFLAESLSSLLNIFS